MVNMEWATYGIANMFKHVVALKKELHHVNKMGC